MHSLIYVKVAHCLAIQTTPY